MVKVEQYNFDNPNTRRNKIAYKVDNPDFYESSWIEYNELLEKSKDYVCWFLFVPSMAKWDLTWYQIDESRSKL